MGRNDISQPLAEEQLLRAYFLGDLPESEEERIQERLFIDPAFFESLLIIEGELVDDYALDLISDQERAKLESGFLASPHQYRKVEFVRTLDQYIANNKAFPSDHDIANGPDEGEGKVKERRLRAAEANRTWLQCLMGNNWLGLELLFQLKAVSQATQTDLATLVERDDASLKTAISLLNHSGLIEEVAEKYTCSAFGSEILERVKEITGHD